MPTYEYVCDSCGYDFDVFQRMTDEPISKCPKCGEHVHKILSGGLGINFKGSGFYVNDNRLNSNANPAPASNTAKPSAGGCSSCSSSSCAGCKH